MAPLFSSSSMPRRPPRLYLFYGSSSNGALFPSQFPISSHFHTCVVLLLPLLQKYLSSHLYLLILREGCFSNFLQNSANLAPPLPLRSVSAPVSTSPQSILVPASLSAHNFLYLVLPFPWTPSIFGARDIRLQMLPPLILMFLKLFPFPLKILSSLSIISPPPVGVSISLETLSFQICSCVMAAVCVLETASAQELFEENMLQNHLIDFKLLQSLLTFLLDKEEKY
ncbi:PREDICTED: uncharacterized protein LOC105958342 isoform X2 [Erythranthe guttata]|uniref:uncharacterized protein LOC105958342 isoform X2 n=1 Tax=Erythranthe guttata TaxID=4155 RepID=UPI00064DA536|nr:PREDICTED: uncharacterized protein LOC105958342 isoform X2 [Erythranthe guttata]|eukprot:XP_012837805.1 PREDICTED: uncharacterized protein LOC105958342 isoform X2 [Erythranthe guttata]